MESVISLIKDYFVNIRDIVSESEIRTLKITDEYAYRQYDEHVLTKNVRNGLAFSVFQLIIGLIFLILSIFTVNLPEQGRFLQIAGSVILVLGAGLYLFYYIFVLDFKRFDKIRYRIVFYASWNIYIIGGFLVSLGYLQQSSLASPFILFASFVFVVPVTTSVICVSSANEFIPSLPLESSSLRLSSSVSSFIAPVVFV